MSYRAIHLENIGKSYRIGQNEPYKTFRDAVSDVVVAPFKYLNSRINPVNVAEDRRFWALKNVSFDIESGDAVGIIGRNGAGKSTLLKILSRITAPTEGYAEIRGRVGSLLEVGTGFHPELTGRENVYLSGAILGMKKSEIDSRFDEILKFAEMEKFIDTPLKHYSSGMNLRLGFAVAAHLDTEILIVDEVLAVGDAAFQKKCMGKMDDVARHEGRTVLFVSHNMTSILGLCNRGVLIDRGMVMKDGEPSEVVNHYLKSTYDTTVKTVLKDRMDRTGNGSIKATGIHFGTQSNAIGGYWVTGENATIELDYECIDNQAYKNIEVALCVHKMDQSKFLYLGTKILKMNILEIHGSGTFACNIPKLPVEPGRYVVHTEFKQNGIIVDYVDSAAMIEVMDGDFYGTGVIWPYGGFLCDYAWTHRPAQH